jgi:hypothetical protein
MRKEVKKETRNPYRCPLSIYRTSRSLLRLGDGERCHSRGSRMTPAGECDV